MFTERSDLDFAGELGPVIPEKPRPIVHGGWESIAWRDCPLAQMYGAPGETMPISNRRADRVYA